jgi:uncharacterized protein YukE
MVDYLKVNPQQVAAQSGDFDQFATVAQQIGAGFSDRVQPLVSQWGNSPTDLAWIKNAQDTYEPAVEASEVLAGTFTSAGVALGNSGKAYENTDVDNSDMLP